MLGASIAIHGHLSSVQRGKRLSEDRSREEGFEIFRNDLVRRLSPTHYVAKNAVNELWYLIELRDGKWNCDCKPKNLVCAHLYAAELKRTTSRVPTDQIDEAQSYSRRYTSRTHPT